MAYDNRKIISQLWGQKSEFKVLVIQGSLFPCLFQMTPGGP